MPEPTSPDAPAQGVPWARLAGAQVEVRVRAQPGARRSEVVGPLGGLLKVRIAAPAVDGKANRELVRVLADLLGVPRRAVRVVRGELSRTKTVAVDDVALDEVVDALQRSSR